MAIGRLRNLVALYESCGAAKTQIRLSLITWIRLVTVFSLPLPLLMSPIGSDFPELESAYWIGIGGLSPESK